MVTIKKSPIERLEHATPSFQLEGRKGKILGRERNKSIKMLLPSTFRDNERKEYTHSVNCFFDEVADSFTLLLTFENLSFPLVNGDYVKNFVAWLDPVHKENNGAGIVSFLNRRLDTVIFCTMKFRGVSHLMSRDIRDLLTNVVWEGDTLLPLIRQARNGMYIDETILRFVYGPLPDDPRH